MIAHPSDAESLKPNLASMKPPMIIAKGKQPKRRKFDSSCLFQFTLRFGINTWMQRRKKSPDLII